MAHRILSDIITNNETQSEILPGIVQKYLQSNEYLGWANTVITDRPTITVPYIADYGTVQKGMDCNTSYTSVAISGGNDIFTLVKYGTQFETCQDVVGLGSSFVEQAMEDMLGGVKRMTNELAVDAIDGTSGEIVGLNTLITDSVAASTVGGSGNISSIWYLFDQVKAKSDKMALVMNAKTKRKLLEVVMGAADVTSQELKGTSFIVPVFNGAAILVNDAMTTGDIALVNGGTDEGIFLAIGNYPGQSVAGLFHFTDVGINQSKDTRIFRLNAHFAHIRKSRQAAAKITSWCAA